MHSNVTKIMLPAKCTVSWLHFSWATLYNVGLPGI